MSRRGQPPKIQPGQYPQLLTLLRAGLRMAEVAAEMGVTRQTLHNLINRDEQVREARDEGRRRRHQQEHGHESCYVERKCRRPECVQAATVARAERRSRAAEAAAAARPSVYELADTAGPFPERPAEPGLADTA